MGKTAWRDTYYVQAYRLAAQGLSDGRIAKVIGVSAQSFVAWKKRRPALRDALRSARNDVSGDPVTFREYVYDRLDPQLKALWDDVSACEAEENGVLRAEALLSKAGTRARQHLFLYALTSSNFNASEACRKVNIDRRMVNRWVEEDENFSRLTDEIQWHKGNFFDNALVSAVDRGDTAAIIFANKTFNRERGYGEKMDVNVNVQGQINHVNAIVRIADLELDLDTRKALLEAVRAKKQLVLEAREDVA